MIYFLPNLFFALSRGTQADPAEEPTVVEEPTVESANAAAESAKAEAEAAAAKKAADEVQPLGACLFCCWIWPKYLFACFLVLAGFEKRAFHKGLQSPPLSLSLSLSLSLPCKCARTLKFLLNVPQTHYGRTDFITDLRGHFSGCCSGKG
jgi:hypothetical protein